MDLRLHPRKWFAAGKEARRQFFSSSAVTLFIQTMSAQDWAPVVLRKKAPATGSTVKDVDAVRLIEAAAQDSPSRRSGQLNDCRALCRQGGLALR